MVEYMGACNHKTYRNEEISCPVRLTCTCLKGTNHEPSGGSGQVSLAVPLSARHVQRR